MAIVQSHNRAEWKKFAAAFSRALSSCSEELTNFGKMAMNDYCREWIAKTDAEWPHGSTGRIVDGVKIENGATFGGDSMHPWFSGQLHDSVAVRIAQGNKTVFVQYMPPRAEYTQFASYKDAGRKYDMIIGADFAHQAIQQAEHTYWAGSKSVLAQLVVGVPYARKVNETSRHYRFLESLDASFADELEDRIMDITEDGKYWGRVFRPKRK